MSIILTAADPKYTIQDLIGNLQEVFKLYKRKKFKAGKPNVSVQDKYVNKFVANLQIYFIPGLPNRESSGQNIHVSFMPPSLVTGILKMQWEIWPQGKLEKKVVQADLGNVQEVLKVFEDMSARHCS